MCDTFTCYLQVSWGKIKTTASPVKVCADASVVFPLIVSQTFVKELERRLEYSRSQAEASKKSAGDQA